MKGVRGEVGVLHQRMIVFDEVQFCSYFLTFKVESSGVHLS